MHKIHSFLLTRNFIFLPSDEVQSTTENVELQAIYEVQSA